MNLDLSTLVVVIIALGAAIGIPLAFASGPRRGTGALWYWAMTLLAIAGGSLLLVLREAIPPVVCIMFGNALIIFALAMLGETASCMTNSVLDGTNRSFFAVITAPVLGLMYVTIDPIWPRIAYMAAVEAYLVLQLASQVHQVRAISAEARQRRPLLFLEVLLWVFFTESLVRTGAVLMLTPTQPFLGQTVVAVAFLVAIVLVAGLTCVVIWNELDARDHAIRRAQTIDIASALPNRAHFLQQLDTHFAAPVAGGTGIVSLIRCAPATSNGANLDPIEEAQIFRSVADQLARFLAPGDLLARIGDAEFGLLLHGDDVEDATATLTLALDHLRTRGAMGKEDRYRMSGRAALLVGGRSRGSAAGVVDLLRGSLDEASSATALIVRA